jgi:hypothetical protein
MHYAEPASTTLTEEQFNALPEILYQHVSEGEEALEDEIVVGKIPTTSELSEEAPNIELPEPLKIELSEIPAIGEDMDFDGGVVEGESTDVEQPTRDLSTTCTICSICIDEFEAGERLILLPRCQHAFHGDCIKPWLMERQGCCPLCKSTVLNSGQDTDSDGSVDASDENAITHDVQN